MFTISLKQHWVDLKSMIKYFGESANVVIKQRWLVQQGRVRSKERNQLSFGWFCRYKISNGIGTIAQKFGRGNAGVIKSN